MKSKKIKPNFFLIELLEPSGYVNWHAFTEDKSEWVWGVERKEVTNTMEMILNRGSHRPSYYLNNFPYSASPGPIKDFFEKINSIKHKKYDPFIVSNLRKRLNET